MSPNDVTGLWVVALIAALFGSLGFVLWLEPAQRRWARGRVEARATFPRDLGTWPVVFRTSGWRGDPFFEGAGVLFLAPGRATLGFLRLKTWWRGRWTKTEPFETLALEALPAGAEVRNGLHGLRFATTDGDVWIGVDTGPTILGSEERTEDLRRALERAFATPAADGAAPPVLVVGRRGPVELWRQPMLAVAVVGIGVGLFGAVRAFLREHQGGPFGFVPPAWLVLLSAIPLGFVVRALRRRGRARWARVELHEDRIVFVREDARTVPLAELAAFDDGETDAVRLVRKDGTRDADLAIPTATEVDRTAVLAFLDRRGLVRAGA